MHPSALILTFPHIHAGPWTKNPLKFDNEYFKNLLELEWKPRDWDGPLQYSDPSGKLMMLPTDMALIEDDKVRGNRQRSPCLVKEWFYLVHSNLTYQRLLLLCVQFLPYVKAYAEDEQLFFKDFAEAFGALLAKGCPAHVQPSAPASDPSDAAMMTDSDQGEVDKEFRDLAMHGSLERMKAIQGTANVQSVEAHSNRTALHKAAFFGHAHVVEYLCSLGADANAQDADGDTALHDAARFGHLAVVKALLVAGADKALKNVDGKTPAELAAANDKVQVVESLS